MQEENENAAPAAETAAPTTEETATTTEQSTVATESGETGAATATATETAVTPQEPQAEEETEDISYQAVQKDGHVTAIWEMQGRKHLRTIDPRSREGVEILRLFTAEHE